ncbi:cationic peptide transport system substrate-binding protein [Colwellia chukchiensis]|uniref:Cationic peptide transport system substrate-binding protein n=1 Tax=Colwellia chukchiensis TaxID=641665 RepID=A0A1H7GRV2_9GAMM|nr:ABC transporter substrate-binding protein [Colwellia chukchiensis]SEK39340.1 cationic peptide transport system substrate-binding protein [Colwellia chukchiensis]
MANFKQTPHYYLTLLLLMLSACDANEALHLSKNSVIYCSEGAPESFNPQTVTSGTTIDATANQLYNRLIEFNPTDNTIIPAIAKSWHVTRDGKMITFYLRKDVQFHHTSYFTPTRKLNADDILFSFNRMLDKTHPYHAVSGGKYPFFQNAQFADLIDSIERINSHTVRFRLNHSDSSFLANIGGNSAVILSKEYADQLAGMNTMAELDNLPIGTGPFKFKQYSSGTFIRYEPHQEYWRGKSELKQLLFDITPRDTGRLTKLLAGECDVIAYPIAHEKIRQHPDLILESVTSFNVGYFGFNTRIAPFDNPKVRQALAYAINKQAILETVYTGQAEIATGLIPNSSWAHDASIIGQEYSVTKAKQLLTEAGYPEGFSMDLWAMPVQRAYNPNAITMAKLIQADLQKLDIKVSIVSDYEWTTFLRKISEGEHQSVLLGWSADHPDPDNFFSTLLSCGAINTGSNRTFWCNQEFDQLVQAALQTDNINTRKGYYSQALALINEQVPLIPIAHSKRYQARAKHISGTLLRSIGGIDFHGVTKN